MQFNLRQSRLRYLFAAPVAAVLLAASSAALADGPTLQNVKETVEINAPTDKVWAVVGDYGDLASWHPAVEASEANNGNMVGSHRVLTLKGGATVAEDLVKYQAEKMSLSYRMKDVGPIPVKDYSSTIHVEQGSSANTSLVVWNGAFYRKSARNDPPADQNDETAVGAITGIYQSGLANLKTQLEAQ